MVRRDDRRVLADQGVLGRRAGPQLLHRPDAHHDRPLREIALLVERRGGVGLAGEERGQQLLLAVAAIELGVGLGLQHLGGLGGRRAREIEILALDGAVLEQPQVAEPAVGAQDRDAQPRFHLVRGVRRDVHGLGGAADAVPEEDLARPVGRGAAEDARGAQRVELTELGGVGERAQLDVVDQHRPAEPDTQRVDDLLERVLAQLRPRARDASCPRSPPAARRTAAGSRRRPPWRRCPRGGCRRTAGGRPSRR